MELESIIFLVCTLMALRSYAALSSLKKCKDQVQDIFESQTQRQAKRIWLEILNLFEDEVALAELVEVLQTSSLPDTFGDEDGFDSELEENLLNLYEMWQTWKRGDEEEEEKKNEFIDEAASDDESSKKQSVNRAKRTPPGSKKRKGREGSCARKSHETGGPRRRKRIDIQETENLLHTSVSPDGDLGSQPSAESPIDLGSQQPSQPSAESPPSIQSDSFVNLNLNEEEMADFFNFSGVPSPPAPISENIHSILLGLTRDEFEDIWR